MAAADSPQARDKQDVAEDGSQDLSPRRPPIWYRRRTLYAVLIGLALAVGLWLSWQLRWGLCLVFLAVLMAIFFDSGAKLVGMGLEKLGVELSRGKRLLIFFVLLVLATAGFTWFAAHTLVQQLDELKEVLPGSVEGAERSLSQFAIGRWLVDNTGGLKSVAEQVQGVAGPVAMSTLNGIVALLFVFVTGLYLTIEPGIYKRGMLWLVPPRWRRPAKDLLDESSERLHYFLLGQFCSMLIVGTLSGLGLWILGVPMPLTNGVITTIMCFVPNIGPIVSVVPPLLLSFSVTDGWLLSGPQLAGAVLVLYLVIQTIESYLITPLIQKQAIEMPPALLITAQFLMGYLIGIVGVAITAPLVVLGMVFVRQIWTDGDVDKDDPMDLAIDPDEMATNDDPEETEAERELAGGTAKAATEASNP